MEEPYRLFFVRKHPRVSTKHQMDEAEKFATEPEAVWVMGREKGVETFKNFLDTIRPGDQVGICRYWLFAPTGKNARGKPRKVLRQITDILLDKQCRIHEIDTGRTCGTSKELLAIYDDALAFLSGQRNQTGNPKGRPKKQVYSDDDKLVIAGVWNDKRHKNADERVTAVLMLKDDAGNQRFPHFNKAAWYQQVKP